MVSSIIGSGCQLVLDVTSVMNMETSGCIVAILRARPACALAIDAQTELHSLGIETPLEPPLVELVEVGTEAEAIQLVALAARCLSNADAASIVAALRQDRALVTDDKRLKTVAAQVAPTLQVFSSLELIRWWRDLNSSN